MPIDPKKLDEFFAQGSPAWERDPELATLVAALLVERESLLSLLREVEWINVGTDWTNRDMYRCPVCMAFLDQDLPYRTRLATRDDQHAHGCRLAAFLSP